MIIISIHTYSHIYKIGLLTSTQCSICNVFVFPGPPPIISIASAARNGTLEVPVIMKGGESVDWSELIFTVGDGTFRKVAGEVESSEMEEMKVLAWMLCCKG